MHKRLNMAQKEATRDPIFLLQTFHAHVPGSKFDHELYVETRDSGGVFLTPESHTEYLKADFSEEGSAEEFWQNAQTMTDADLVKYGIGSPIWVTRSVWFTREEAEHHAGVDRPHHYGQKDKDWRVYCVTADGELASVLVDRAAPGTNELYYLQKVEGGLNE